MKLLSSFFKIGMENGMEVIIIWKMIAILWVLRVHHSNAENSFLCVITYHCKLCISIGAVWVKKIITSTGP